MSGPPGIAYSIYGAARLAIADPQGLDWFVPTRRGFWHSFRAAWILAPFYLLLTLVELSGQDGPLFLPLLLEGESYVISWVAYPLVMLYLCDALGRSDRFLLYATAYNWVALLQNLIYLPIPLLLGIGLLTPDAADLLLLSVLAAVSVYSWYVARLTLDVSGVTAAGIVLLDLLLALAISGGIDRVVYAF